MRTQNPLTMNMFTFLEISMLFAFLRMCYYRFQYHSVLSTVIIMYAELLWFKYYYIIDKLMDTVFDYISKLSFVQKFNLWLLNMIIPQPKTFKTNYENLVSNKSDKSEKHESID